MPRPTKSEIQAEIIDKAAGLFARHGFSQTSLQQIADSVRYTKAGLLNHYPSKQAVYDAALQTVARQMQELLARVDAVKPGSERDLAVCNEIVDLTYDWPGLSALGIASAHGSPLDDPQLIAAGEAVFKAFALDPTTVNDERFIRVTVAMAGLGMAAMTALSLDLRREWRATIIDAAMAALGHFQKHQVIRSR